MAAIKRRGIFAVPGEFTYGDVTEIKTAEELKLAAERQPIIRLVMGHPVDNHPYARDVIGTVSQKWDEKNQRVNGDFWFYGDMIPDSIRDKLVNYQPIAVSAGIMLDDIVDSVQKGISYTHMAVLEDDDPECPLGTCGINIRMESKPNRIVRYEQSTELEAPKDVGKSDEPELPTEDTEKVEEVITEEVEETEPEPEESETEPAEQKPEEVEPEPEEEVILVPEVIIPVGTTAPKEWERDEDGMIIWTPRIFRDEK